MKLQLSVILFFLVVLATCCCLEAQSKEQNEVQVEAGGRASLALPKLFDFGRFKTMFKKRYNSLMEEVARKKLFLARAFRAFLSFISYKHYKSSSYLKISEMSDWSHAELRAIEVRRPVDESKAPKLSEPKEEAEDVADLDEIESKLKQLVSEHKDEPGYSEIVAELKQASKRRKRDVSNTRSDLSVEDLFEQDSTSSNAVNTLDNKPEPKRNWHTKLLDSVPGVVYINQLLNGASNGLLFERPTIEKTNLPDETFIDHRKSNCLSGIKMQGNCGSCYIFSTIALYEFLHCRETGKLVEFSEQFALDCGDPAGLRGCRGGNEVDVARFIGIYGLELRNNYPYRMRADSCPYDDDYPTRRMGYMKVKEPALKTINFTQIDEYLEKSPVLMGFGVSDDFHAYGGGVDLGERCQANRGHSMIVVGSGREDGVEYYLVRNSYGRTWGQNGYYKLAKQATNCFLDGGVGWVLDKKVENVFDVNKENNPSYVKDHYFTYPSSVPAW